MKEILRLMNKGGRTTGELAEKLGIPKERLMLKIEALARMGYVEEWDPGETSCAGAGSCVGCKMSRICGGKGESIPRPILFIISEKGKRLLD